VAASKRRRKLGFLRRLQHSERFLNAVGDMTAAHIRMVFATSKIIREPDDTDAKFWANHPCIVCMWHGQFLMLPKIKPDGLRVRNFAARHIDGEMIARSLLRFDMELIRGAGAGPKGKDRGGAHALRAAVKSLKEGYAVALTADVPPGPARVAGLGIVTMARLSGRPILPTAIATNRFITFDTWSRFTVNLPFSRLAIVVGDPIYVPRDIEDAGLEAFRRRVQHEMNAVTERAYALVGSDAKRVLPVDPRTRPPEKIGALLGGYRALTTAARPLSGYILDRRAADGKEVPERLGERRGLGGVPRPDGPLWWFHAASVGETNAILPLIEALRRRYPKLHILLTTVTVTSARIAEARLPAGAIHQFVPLDSPVFVRRFLNHWSPDLALLTESEIWPNLIVEAADAKVPLVLLNARMSERSFRRWSRLRSLSGPLFSRFDLVLTQDHGIAKRLERLGARNTIVSGNLKYDAPPPPVERSELEGLRRTIGQRPVFLAASTHPGEDEVIARVHTRLKTTLPSLLTIVAPRHPERGEPVARLMSQESLVAVRRSLVQSLSDETDIYIADTIGELGLFYSLAPWAFIGGSLIKHGGQNPLEAVKLGAGVLSGPHVFNFAETYRTLTRYGACRVVTTGDELAAAVKLLFASPEAAAEMKRHAALAVETLGGALDKTLAALEPYTAHLTETPALAAPLLPRGAQLKPDYAA
jgi:3-deoxy-D-manno-octulosonic-acid transferase